MTDTILLAVIFAVVAFSHVMAILPFIRKASRRELPSGIDFCCIALLLYYDLALFYELCGVRYTSPYISLFSLANHTAQFKTVCLLILAPWLLRLGAHLANAQAKQEFLRKSSLLPLRKKEFYLLCTVMIASVLILGGSLLFSGIPIWLLRASYTARLGAAIILMYIPMSMLAFYVLQTNSMTLRGTLMMVALLIASLLAALPTAERTSFLLPLVICFLFRRRLQLSHFIAMIVIGLLAAALLLPVLKWQYAGKENSVFTLVNEMIFVDLAKPPVLADIIDHADGLNTRVLPYPGAGYVYSLFFYIPREFAPFKGYSSSVYYTSQLAHTAPEDTNWGLSIGCLEEIVLNFGFLLSFPILLIYGVCIGMFDRLASKAPSFLVPSRLGTIWVIGQHLPAVLLIFGTMTGIIWLCRRRYVDIDATEVAIP